MILNDDLLGRIRAAIDLPGEPASTRLVCAMSGGVDSSVAAGLAKRAGYDVVGITLQLYDHGRAGRTSRSCCAGQDIHDARRVAAKLGIPHYVLDFESRFREAVIDDFADSYLRGETPVPCIRCNQTVKFADLMMRARELGAAALLTGHYVGSRARADASGHRDLMSAADLSRDQSYFLFATTQAQIDFLRFPLAFLTKAETRRLASELGLAVADKPDSQDICFVPEGRYADVIARLRPEAMEPGEIVHVDGRRLGRHAGILNYTVGQRRGLGVAEGAPLYVTGIDAPRRRVIVGPREALAEREMFLNEVNWLGDRPLASQPLPVYARIRSTRAPVAAEVALAEQGIKVRLNEEEFGVSPGQACVLYERPGAGARLLGGGFIAARRKPALQEAALAVTY
ncbi:MAG: tRNA 2-thiouridine(34) synthase MnmA [Rhizobiales bacterium]|nr:tRNA 2-thiouridine(34) synthase MnmA [Hyphomicrobiales bacterium]